MIRFRVDQRSEGPPYQQIAQQVRQALLKANPASAAALPQLFATSLAETQDGC